MPPPQPHRVPSSHPPAGGRGPGSALGLPAFEVVKARVLVKLHDRLDPGKSRRMPISLLQQSARQQVEQVIEAEAPRMPRADRDRLVAEVLTEVFGFGPLEELFRDPGVAEVLVLGPHAVLARREGGWVPTNVKFRDADQLRDTLEKAAAYGEAVGAGLPATAIDAKLPNGFRAVAVVPPPEVDQPGSAAFVRTTAPAPAAPPPATPTQPRSGQHPGLPPAAPVQAGSGRFRGLAIDPADPNEGYLARHRARITELLIKRMASLGVYDLTKLDTATARRVVAAYIEEYCAAERVRLTAAEQGRLTLEIIAGMNR
jgi:pilus assembly protein CpaF